MSKEPENRISEKALKVWRMAGGINAAISWGVIATAIFLIYLFNWPQWISILLIVFGVSETYFLVLLLPKLRWQRWRYEVREDEIEFQKGIFIRTRTLIPMIRVQHVDTVQGPLLRKYQLASVIVNTAATAREIPALEEHEAEELRHYISNLAKVADEDV